MDFGSAVAPQVMPGDYTLKLKVADKEYTQPVKVVHDPASPFTLAEREQQQNSAWNCSVCMSNWRKMWRILLQRRNC